MRPRRMQDRLQHQIAALDAGAIGEGADVDQPLAHLDRSLDHPVEGATFRQFFDALGHHAGRVEVFSRLATRPFFANAQRDPVLQLFDAFTADAQFYEIQCHVLNVGWRAVKVKRGSCALHSV